MFLRKIRILSVLIFFLAACAAQPTEPPLDVNVLYTQLVGTLSVSIQQTQASIKASLATPTYFSPTPTNTFLPTQTVSATPQPTWTNIYVAPAATYAYFTNTPGTPQGTVTVNPEALAVGCSNLEFIRDVTVPEGTEFNPGDNFDKIWKVQNTGTCPWLYQSRLVLLSGGEYGSYTSPLGKKVEVNDWAEVSVNIDAPNQPGEYKSYWRMSDVNGNMFGATLELSFVVK